MRVGKACACAPEIHRGVVCGRSETTSRERRVLVAGFLGYGLDGFDFMIYTFVIPTLRAAGGMSKTEAGYIETASLITSAVGGWAAGGLRGSVRADAPSAAGR